MTVKMIVITTAKEGFETTEITIPDGEDATVVVNLPESKVTMEYETPPTMINRDTGEPYDIKDLISKTEARKLHGQLLQSTTAPGGVVSFNSYDS